MQPVFQKCDNVIEKANGDSLALQASSPGATTH